ncbi:hypothetical protein U1Q18_052753 [Sarracenia purpurea var. burkii]
MSPLQYDEKLFLPEQKDQNLPRSKLDSQVVLFLLVHKDQILIFPDFGYPTWINKNTLHFIYQQFNPFKDFLFRSRQISRIQHKELEAKPFYSFTSYCPFDPKRH